MFKRKPNEHEELKKRIVLLEEKTTNMASHVGYKSDRWWSLAINPKAPLAQRVDALEESWAQLNSEVKDIKNVLLTAGIIKRINDEEPALTTKVYGLFGDPSTAEYGVVNPVKAGKKRG